MAASPTSMPRKWRLALALSLALNLLFLGAIAGAAWRHAAHDAERARIPRASGFATPYLRAMPPGPRAEFHEAARQMVGAHGFAARAARRAHYTAVAEALRADPFDPAALDALLGEQRQAAVGHQAGFQQAWLLVVAGMDSASRRAYADALIAQLDRRHGRRSDHRDRRD